MGRYPPFSGHGGVWNWSWPDSRSHIPLNSAPRRDACAHPIHCSRRALEAASARSNCSAVTSSRSYRIITSTPHRHVPNSHHPGERLGDRLRLPSRQWSIGHIAALFDRLDALLFSCFLSGAADIQMRVFLKTLLALFRSRTTGGCPDKQCPTDLQVPACCRQDT